MFLKLPLLVRRSFITILDCSIHLLRYHIATLENHFVKVFQTHQFTITDFITILHYKYKPITMNSEAVQRMTYAHDLDTSGKSKIQNKCKKY